MTKKHMKRLHRIVMTVRFSRPIYQSDAVAYATDSIHGEFFPDSLHGETAPDTMFVKGFQKGHDICAPRIRKRKRSSARAVASMQSCSQP